jgi:hypothetical protein
MLSIGVPAFALKAIKSLVVIFVILLYSEQVRSVFRKISTPKSVQS